MVPALEGGAAGLGTLCVLMFLNTQSIASGRSAIAAIQNCVLFYN